MLRDIIIIGSGLSGLSAALALSHYLTPLISNLRITIFELHPIPSTSGGALSLSPVAMRHFDHLGVLEELEILGPDGGIPFDAVEIFSSRTGKPVSRLDYAGQNGLGYAAAAAQHGKRYRARRVMRINLSLAMMAAAEKRGNIKIVYGKKFVKAVQLEDRNRIEAHFEDNSIATGHLLLGCDGVWSATRRKFVDPGWEAEYTGYSLVQGTVALSKLQSGPHFREASLNLSRSGSLLLAFHENQRQDLFASAMVECCEESVQDHTNEGKWTRDQINASLGEEIGSRFRNSALPLVREVATSTEVDWMMYPIYQIPLGGKWYTQRAILIGDAAHAMLPRDESAAYAIDDTILLARILSEHLDYPLEETFQIYDSLRRRDIRHAFTDATKLWHKRNSDAGTVETWIREHLIPFQIRNEQVSRKMAFEYDASRAAIPSLSRPVSSSSSRTIESKRSSNHADI